MHAALTHRYGAPEVLELESVPRPSADQLGPDQVLIRVEAAPIHKGDWHLLTGRPFLIRVFGFGFRRPKQPRLGLFVCGTVEAKGSAVEHLEVGDRVHGNAAGSFAEFTVADTKQLIRTPERLSSEEAAALTNSGSTVVQAIRNAGGLREGQRVLVLGAAGSVGGLAVQIAKAKGAVVDAVCSSRSMELARSLGADRVIAYDQGLAFETDSYDLILDTAARLPHRRIRELLRPNGRCVMIALGHDPISGGLCRGLRALARSRFTKKKFVFLFSEPDQESLTELNALVEEHGIRPTIADTVELTQVAEGFHRVGSGGVHGTLAVSMRPSA